MTTSVLETIDTSGILSLPQAAHALSLHYQTAYSMVLTGRLPARQFAGRWLLDVADVERFKRELRKGEK